ncbi:MAG: AAA family ATPase [Planctomycetota bacterium]
MNVLSEILEWSADRPEWMRDALRRLVASDTLSDDDVADLVAICKAKQGLGKNPPKANPLAQKHLRSEARQADAVVLKSVTHLQGVNALAESQTVTFGPALTVVYGPNGTGKSGYTRLLKKACRARGTEEILGNVYGGKPLKPTAAFVFSAGDQEITHEWRSDDSDAQHEALGRVSVFDSHSAAVYVKDKTDVAFRPFGLDLFDKLSALCETVKARLEQDRKASMAALGAMPSLPAGSTAAAAVGEITLMTDPAAIRQLGTLHDAERKRLNDLRATRAAAIEGNTDSAARATRLAIQRVGALRTHLERVEAALSPDVLIAARAAQAAAADAEKAAALWASKMQGVAVLPGTGTPEWTMMWGFARAFSMTHAYPGVEFPATASDCRCVLCQQELDRDGVKRLTAFRDAVALAMQQGLQQAGAQTATTAETLEAVEVESDLVEDLKVEDQAVARKVSAFLTKLGERRDKVVAALTNTGKGSAFPKLAALEPPLDELDKVVAALEARLDSLTAAALPDEQKRQSAELAELEARDELGRHLDRVLAQIDALKQDAAYLKCIEETSTNAVTRKSTELTRKVVTSNLQDAFIGELQQLGFRHLEVELKSTGSKGTLYHQLVLKRSPSSPLPRVVSEGEGRCIAMAAFLAELGIANDRSAILFDDPVSSLDHEWREGVARRLAAEAATRQVIVFTHDVAFLLALARFAETNGIECRNQHLRRASHGAGITSADLPWISSPVRERIGILRSRQQKLPKMLAESPDDYDREVPFLYGLLREAWERAIEEVLLNKTVERFGAAIHAMRVREICDITPDDYTALATGMAKCSRWLPGHDQPAADGTPMPEPTELGADISELDNWITAIRKRRDKTKRK